ncbi:MAG: CDGSH iron-sulfur domain-containing protein [Burkholderiales bacterium]
MKAQGGPLAIRPIKNGPLHVKGNLTIVAGSGLERWHGAETWLCRCGQSKNKPFCDGSHKKVGFKSE